jgi:hypothetical protein
MRRSTIDVSEYASSVLELLQPRCSVPVFDGAIFSVKWKEALWAKFFTAAPLRQRRSVEQYKTSCLARPPLSQLLCRVRLFRATALALVALTNADNRGHVPDHRFKAGCIIPAAERLIDHRPRRQIVGQHSPRSVGPGQPVQCVERFAQTVAPLRRLLVKKS